jgi:hypothetical protein
MTASPSLSAKAETLAERVEISYDQRGPVFGDFNMSRRKLWRWAWPLGIVVAGVGTAAAVVLRGCWHTHMSWPTQYDDHYSYRVCTDCGVMRLFDPESFRGYGPYGYDLRELIARDRVRHKKLSRGEKHPARDNAVTIEGQGV